MKFLFSDYKNIQFFIWYTHHINIKYIDFFQVFNFLILNIL